MRTLSLIILSLFFIHGAHSQTTLNKLKRGTVIFFRGFSSPVFRTDGQLEVKNVDDDVVYIIDGGLVYRTLGEEDGLLYLKVLSGVKNTNKTIEIDYITDDATISNQLFKVAKADLKQYNKIWQQGLSWSTLLLPIKFRPETELNGTQFNRTFSSDVSVGPFFGYKFKAGKFYDQFVKIGAFAGPTLIQFPSEVTPNNGQTNQNNITNDNLIGFSYGWGIVYQFNALQIGLINGKDYLGGEKSKEWQYDGNSWWSFAIGYKFAAE